mmetsp:Transcript_23796/g.50808  ORF Transcript_23796/g.50808 Transcript_23796/m.50808 type:complete len:236 (-) Transcript_23796:237-944(-)
MERYLSLSRMEKMLELGVDAGVVAATVKAYSPGANVPFRVMRKEVLLTEHSTIAGKPNSAMSSDAQDKVIVEGFMSCTRPPPPMASVVLNLTAKGVVTPVAAAKVSSLCCIWSTSKPSASSPHPSCCPVELSSPSKSHLVDVGVFEGEVTRTLIPEILPVAALDRTNRTAGRLDTVVFEQLWTMSPSFARQAVLKTKPVGAIKFRAVGAVLPKLALKVTSRSVTGGLRPTEMETV